MLKKTSYRLLTVLLIVLIFVLPLLMAELAFKYYRQHPQKMTMSNRGILLKPVIDVATLDLQTESGASVVSDFKNKWSLLYIVNHFCDKQCVKNLYYLRQIHTATAKKRMQVQRIIATQTNYELKALHRYPGTHHLIFGDKTASAVAQNLVTPLSTVKVSAPQGSKVLTLDTNKIASALKQNLSSSSDTAVDTDLLLIVDPQQKIMLCYQKDFKAKDVLHDLKRLLRAAS